ncbi:hypothetical protein scyTo_0018030, partial [Scyliorhinus torazame]|nr:hypothetical protein [Scyliorhinus torazame]
PASSALLPDVVFPSSVADAISQIVRKEGVLALWSSTIPSLLLVFNPAIQFMFYEGLKRHLMRGRTELLSLEVFIIGAIAKAIATTVTYPLQTVQSILREAGFPGPVQGLGGEAAADGSYLRPDVPHLREDCRLHFPTHGSGSSCGRLTNGRATLGAPTASLGTLGDHLAVPIRTGVAALCFRRARWKL